MLSHFRNLNQYIKNRAAAEEHQFVLYGTISLSGFISFYFINLVIMSGSNENVWLRSIAAILALGLVLKNYWPQKLKGFMHYYWYISLIYGLPFFFTYMLFENNWSLQWQLNELMSLTLLAIITDWIGVILFGSIGVLLSYMSYYLVNSAVPIPLEVYSIISTYATILIFVAVFLQKNKFFNSELIRLKDKLNHDLEEKVEQRTEALKKALDAKSYFLRNVNHEIRTPVQIITTLAEELKDNWEKFSKNRIRGLLQELDHSAQRLFSLVTNVLALSKFDSGKMLFNIQESDLAQTITNAINEFKPLARDKKVKITFEANAKYTTADFDSERIMQVLRNLISNSLKYSPQNSSITVTLTEREMAIKDGKKTRALCVAIKDSGVGVPEEELVTIFEPFIQSTKTDTKAGGTGLGLSICSEIVYNHGGRIWAENNKKDSGTTFFFMLPLGIQSEEEGKTISHNTTIRVLFVDDEYGCQEIVPMILSKIGCELKVCTSGKEALEYLEHSYQDVDVILLDMMMPGMSGMEVLKVLKATKEYRDIPVLLQTGLDNDLELNKALSLGALGHISKPYNKERMQKQVTEAFANSPYRLVQMQ